MRRTALPQLADDALVRIYRVAEALNPHADPMTYYDLVRDVLPGEPLFVCAAVLDAVERARRLWLAGVTDDLDTAYQLVGLTE